MGVQRHYKKNVSQKSASKKGYKKTTKNSKPIFSRFCLITNHVFWRFSVRGVQKHDKKFGGGGGGGTSPCTVLATEEPTNHVGVRRFFFWLPLGKKRNQKRIGI
jgi:hypothetical protein